MTARLNRFQFSFATERFITIFNKNWKHMQFNREYKARPTFLSTEDKRARLEGG